MPCFAQMHQFQHGRAGHDGQRQQEREPGRGLAVEADEQGGGDGYSRAGNPGNQGKALGEADDEGELQGDPVHFPPFGAGGVGKGENQAEDDQQAGDEEGIGAEDLLDRVFQGLADDSGRNGAGYDVEGEPVRRRVEAVTGKAADKIAGKAR